MTPQDALRPRDEAIAGFMLDATVKVIPPGVRLRLDQIGAQGWNLLRGDLPLPLAVLRRGALQRNAAWMRDFCRLNDLSLCPHGKTTMAPQLWDLQIAEGAWGITVATLQQLEVARRFGIKRVIWANQPTGRLAVDAAFAALTDPGFELFVLADSAEVVAALAAGAARAGLARPLPVLLEVGMPGGRTGARDATTALTLARTIAATPGLVLAGVEAFEGLLPDTDAVDRFLPTLAEVARGCAAEDLFGHAEVLLTAGGTAFFDRIAPGFAAAGELGRPVRRVLRSGCYITHDSMGYADAYARMRREAKLHFPDGDLEHALEVWTVVQSVPEPRLAILACGKRDAGFDLGWPVPIRQFRPGAQDAPQPFGAFHKISGMNDQHGYLVGPTEQIRVGDLICLGIGHPCSTFDRWQILPLVEDDLTVSGVIRTFF